MSYRFGEMLAHHIGAPVFAVDYRLTPEHPHPAQADDALAAWGHLTETVSPDDIVIVGDSAGGHMVLMLLQELKAMRRAQPAGAIALSPWTDIGDSGPHLHANDRTDLVQGWMAVQFGTWLNPDGQYARADLSPISCDYSDCAPIYIQVGGREIFHQTAIEFAEVQGEKGAQLMLDVWPDMPHDFQLFDSSQNASTEALLRIADAVRFFTGETECFSGNSRTVVSRSFGARGCEPAPAGSPIEH